MPIYSISFSTQPLQLLLLFIQIDCVYQNYYFLNHIARVLCRLIILTRVTVRFMPLEDFSCVLHISCTFGDFRFTFVVVKFFLATHKLKFIDKRRYILLLCW